MIWQMDPRTLVGTFLGAYHIDELLGHNELGPLFAATGNDAQRNRYLVRPLTAVANPAGDPYAPHLDRFRQQATAVAALKHPYILPLLDYGIVNGLPYLVWPWVSARSVSAQVAQSGPLDTTMVGGYLDQIASALEYAHDRGMLHLDLTTDCIQVQADGRMVVTDFGVCGMLQLGTTNAQGYPLQSVSDAAAPELLLGAAPSPATDIYGLGAVLYRLLTAHPVFSAQSAEAAAQMHLNAPVPPLGAWRLNLPPALDDILASAMAKQPDQRFQRPGALANAYHYVVAPDNSARVPFNSAAALLGEPPSAVSSAGGLRPMRAPSGEGHLLRSGSSQAYAPLPTPPGGIPPARATHPPAARRPRRAGLPRNVVWSGLLMLVVVVTVLSLALLRGALQPAAPVSGTAAFLDNANGVAGQTDAVTINAYHLPALTAGSYYDAWLVDTSTEAIHPLGTLTGNGDAFTLTYSGDSSGGTPGTNLLSLGNRLEITREQGAVNVPVGPVVLSGTWPAEAFVHLRHLLVSYPTTPHQIGLVVGLLRQAQILDANAFALQALANSHDPSIIQCGAQSMLDIIEGTRGTNYHALTPYCAAHNITEVGDGFGLLGADGYLTDTATHASNAATAPDATAYVREHAAHVTIAVQNMQGWLTTLDQDTLALLNNPSDLSKLPDIVTLSDHTYHGVQTSGDQAVQPIRGQAGAVTAYDHAQFMATLTLS